MPGIVRAQEPNQLPVFGAEFDAFAQRLRPCESFRPVPRIDQIALASVRISRPTTSTPRRHARIGVATGGRPRRAGGILSRLGDGPELDSDLAVQTAMVALDPGDQDLPPVGDRSKRATPARSVSTGSVCVPSASICSTTGVRLSGSLVTFIQTLTAIIVLPSYVRNGQGQDMPGSRSKANEIKRCLISKSSHYGERGEGQTGTQLFADPSGVAPCDDLPFGAPCAHGTVPSARWAFPMSY